VFRDAPFAPELVVIPAGEFWMGSGDEEEGGYEGERPRHRVTIGQRFAIGRYPVTFEEYVHFCVAEQRKKPDDRGWGKKRRPVIDVSWQDAQDYLAWLSQKVGRAYRLPSEAEWEYACRAGTTTRYSFGDAITPEKANFSDSGLGRTSRVGAYRRTPGGSMTCTAMSGSGQKMIGTKITGERRPLDRRGGSRAHRQIRAFAWFAAATGTTFRGTAGPPSAARSIPITAAAMSGSGWPEHFLNS
jgi:formylglycine-generating enzyme required for sulfatase activity